MRNMTRLALAALAVVAIVAAGAFYWNSNNVGVPVPTAPPTPSPGASPSPVDFGVLAPGRHRSNFDPPFTYAVPAGWTILKDTSDEFDIAPAALNGGSDLYVCKNPTPANGHAAPVSGVANNAQAITTWLASRPDLAFGTPEPLSLGGLRGYSLDLKGRAATNVNIIGTIGGCGRDIYPDQRVRVALLDYADGTIFIVLWDTLGEVMIEEGTAVALTFEFEQ